MELCHGVHCVTSIHNVPMCLHEHTFAITGIRGIYVKKKKFKHSLHMQTFEINQYISKTSTQVCCLKQPKHAEFLTKCKL